MIEKVLAWAEDHWTMLAAFIAILVGFGKWNLKLRDDVAEHERRIGEIEEDSGKRDVTGLWTGVREHGGRLDGLEGRCKEHRRLFDLVFEKLDENTKAVHELIGELRAMRKNA